MAHTFIELSQGAEVVMHAHIQPCSEGNGGAHWLHDPSKKDVSNQFHFLGRAGKWNSYEKPWDVSAGGASAKQESRPRSVVIHDPTTMAKALCCDLAWD